VFDLPIEINWDAFDGEVLTYARGRDRDIVEGRFINRKLPGYLLRGSLGNIVIGVILLVIAAFMQFVTLSGQGPRSVVTGASIARAGYLSAGSRDFLGLDTESVDEGNFLRTSASFNGGANGDDVW